MIVVLLVPDVVKFKNPIGCPKPTSGHVLPPSTDLSRYKITLPLDEAGTVTVNSIVSPINFTVRLSIISENYTQEKLSELVSSDNPYYKHHCGSLKYNKPIVETKFIVDLDTKKQLF